MSYFEAAYYARLCSERGRYTHLRGEGVREGGSDIAGGGGGGGFQTFAGGGGYICKGEKEVSYILRSNSDRI